MTSEPGALEITHFGHACVLVESQGARVLIDPGAFSVLPDDLGEIDAVAVTHAHYDHVSADLVASVLAANPEAVVIAPASVELEGVAAESIRRVAPGDTLRVGEATIAVLGGLHARIHADVPQTENVGFFFVADAVLHPGDEFVVPNQPVSVLCAPISGPWQSLEDVVDYVRTIRPATIVPIHEGMLARPQVYIDYLRRLGPQESAILVPAPAEPVRV